MGKERTQPLPKKVYKRGRWIFAENSDALGIDRSIYRWYHALSKCLPKQDGKELKKYDCS
jgi:hypothetical protein